MSKTFEVPEMFKSGGWSYNGRSLAHGSESYIVQLNGGVIEFMFTNNNKYLVWWWLDRPRAGDRLYYGDSIFAAMSATLSKRMQVFVTSVAALKGDKK